MILILLLFFHFSQMKVIFDPFKVQIHVFPELLFLLFIKII